MTPSKLHYLSRSLLASALVLGLCACGNQDGKKSASQVAATVGSDEITILQVNHVLSRTKTAGASPEALQKTNRDILEKLIEQQLAVGQAVEAKLDRTPDVITQLEASRREILARAYMQKIAGAVPKASAEEAQKYFADHPQLFSERRIYNVQEISVAAAPGVADQLRAFAAANKPIEVSASWLKSQGIKYAGGSATRAAEQLPLAHLPQVHALKDGQSLVIESPQNITLLRVASSKSSPVTREFALPRIEQFLNVPRVSEAMASKMKQLRAEAKITYVGEYANAAETGASATTAAAPAAAGVAPAGQPVTEQDKTNAIFDKGAAGLK